MNKSTLYLKFEGLSRPIALVDCHDLIDHFSIIFSGWRITEVSESAQLPVLTLRYEETTYILESDWIKKPLYRKDKTAAICGLVAEIVRAFVNDDVNLLCLHGAAADFGGKLVIFPNKYRAGKSILSACLVEAGIDLFCDDALPITLSEGHGRAMGIAPCLRVPLPDNLSADTRRFIETNTVLKGRRYFYLDLKEGGLATRGSYAPVGGFVLLEREEGVTATLEAIPEGEVLRQVVWQNFAREAEAPLILGCLSLMVANARRYLLRYDRAEDAVTLLKETFKDWPEIDHKNSAILPVARQNNLEPVEIQPGCYLRKAGVEVTIVDGESFLADAQGAAIHHLNPVGSAIWNLLTEPTTLDAMVELLLVAFPEAGREQIEADVGVLIKSLLSKSLLVTGPDPHEV